MTSLLDLLNEQTGGEALDTFVAARMGRASASLFQVKQQNANSRKTAIQPAGRVFLPSLGRGLPAPLSAVIKHIQIEPYQWFDEKSMTHFMELEWAVHFVSGGKKMSGKTLYSSPDGKTPKWKLVK